MAESNSSKVSNLDGRFDSACAVRMASGLVSTGTSNCCNYLEKYNYQNKEI